METTIVEVENKPEHALEQEIVESLEDVLTEGIFRVTPGHEIVFASRVMLALFGYRSVEEVRAKFNVLFADETDLTFLIDKLTYEGSLQNYRALCIRKDRSNFWGSLTCHRVMRAGEVFFDGMIIDITEIIKQEQQLQEKNDVLEKLTMELDRFIYSASHDIRSPVSSIQGLISLMKLELKDENSQNLVKLMEVSADRLDRFVRSLTSFAENAKKEIKPIHVDFERVLNHILEKLMLHPSHVNISVARDITQENTFYSDLFRTRLIIHNVVKNAFDYCDLSKSHPVISIQIVTHPEKAVIEVFDNGIGIAAPFIERVFDMFYRGTDASSGSGMGLYTAREAVIKLAGIITISSEYGIGTSVRIELPNSTKGKLINKKNLLKGI